jgi:hypothetical protein
MDNYSVTWIFRNQHEWSNTFTTPDERIHFINCVGLVTHPDIVRIYITDPEGGDWDLKRVAE